MSHMPTYGDSGSSCSGGSSCGGRIVEYVATGSEPGAGFTVPIGATLASSEYRIGFFGVEDDVIVPLGWSFPAGSRSTTSFEARFVGDSLTAAATYLFQIVED